MTTALKRITVVAALAGAALMTGCAVLPEGPTHAALPGSRATYDQFQIDDATCRQYSTQAIGGTSPQQNANNAAVGSAVVGTALGAAIGGLLGGHDGAAVGAGMGLFTGAAVGAGNSQAAGYGSQQRYDNAYYQCMYARGHRVPVPASVARSMRQANNTSYPPPPNAPAPYAAPPPNAAIPPPNAPPPGAPPPSDQAARFNAGALRARFAVTLARRTGFQRTDVSSISRCALSGACSLSVLSK